MSSGSMFEANASLIPDISNPFLSDLVGFSNGHTNQLTISRGLASRQIILSLFRLNKLQPCIDLRNNFLRILFLKFCCRKFLSYSINGTVESLKSMYHVCEDKCHFTRIFFHLGLYLFCGMAMNTSKIKRTLWFCRIFLNWQCFLFHSTISWFKIFN